MADNTEIERGYIVAKSNHLVQRSRYNLTETEQKIVLYLISKIQPDDEQLQPYTFTLPEFCRLCGIDYRRNRGTYDYIRRVVQTLSDKSFWVQQEREKVLCRWISKARTDDDSLNLTVRLDDDLAPYLLQLRDCFTAYELECVLAMHSKYAIRLYEILKSYANLGGWTVDLDELRDILCLEGAYQQFREFRRNILDKAIPEINEYSDLRVTWEPITKGRKVTAIYFSISRKGYGEYPHTRSARSARLDRS